MKKIPALVLALLLFTKIFSQSLSDTEKKIIDWVKKHTTEAEKLLEEAVNINSGTFNIAGVKKTGEVFARELQKAGLNTEWVSLPDSLKRAGHLVASRKGNKGKKIFIIGHLDTVFEPDMAAGPFTRINDSTATGQGVTDMKGGDVVVVMALQALHSMNLLKDASVVVYFTGDEEESGKPTSVSRKDFIERARTCDLALAFETAQGMNTIAIGRRGFSSWKLDVTAKTGHSAGIFGQGSGYGAIYETARILNRFREELGNEKHLTFNPGIIAGGSEMDYDDEKMRALVSGKTNIISPSVVVEGDLRFLTEKQRETARQKMTAIVASQNLNGSSAKISFTDGIPAMEPTKGNDSLRLWVDRVSRDMGLGPANAGDPGSRGAGDISYVAKYIDCIDGLGASGRGAHAVGETINLKQLPLLIQRAALLIYRLTQSE
ncbi:M20/M25/M40 family metallo-hydrolase [Sediminibacterium sp.]|uniref:M20/M25/M40 family metallo-hydrolase n=1 Tax=Sediminibacterium sp. TaxID=1917865 RepID=UPI0025F9DF09|nr:M20/M25/M40 family metallo-hydrolase [Sediminibacterium sp.]MBW0176561.1 M20/M25/M40 family metallo-hydrolase [Sediminibacterium sp.]